ncbi:hypothetical protein A1O3_02680 [Capronia epimyces CBS 606.96]|uniref:TauD/TfdA-like domain-containing protein n=1 Tax=Capronia epimyces CBS 606.96 TaxID=1182542 RepID=W9YAR1_9EURO|nr:uncharacterized protein A1O3_02680 [Capronia epimyces CBS 606.96]EXJ89613.1 hypothetical protein A1O3_02680 [Capronia epimyces CBS 606.96]
MGFATWIHGFIHDILMRSYLVLQLVAENHDLQVRFRWNKNDIAIWDNDYDAPRAGNRVVSIGEKPYLDPRSVSRRRALAKL